MKWVWGTLCAIAAALYALGGGKPPQHQAVRAHSATTTDVPRSPALPGPVPSAATPPTEIRPRLSDNPDRYREFLGVAFEQDAHDESWKPAAEAQIRTGIEPLRVQGVMVRNLECRATLCRLVLTGSDPTVSDRAKLELLPRTRWRGPGVVSSAPPERPNEFRIVAFFGREGRDLPDG
jgi:hypothetical protein